MLEGFVLGLVLGLVLGGLLIPTTFRLPFVGRCRTSPTGAHEYIQLKGAYAYCGYCTARRRYLAG